MDRSRRLRSVAFIVVTVLLASALVYGVTQPAGRFVARRWEAELSELPVDGAVERVALLGADNDRHEPLLVIALANPREPVAAKAGEVLSRRVDRWQLLEAPAASQRIAELTERFARDPEGLSPVGLAHARVLVRRFLTWPLDRSVVDAAAFVGHCERILRARPRGSVVTSVSERPTTPGRGPAELPGGELPYEPVRSPAGSGEPTPAATQIDPPGAPPAAAPAEPQPLTVLPASSPRLLAPTPLEPSVAAGSAPAPLPESPAWRPKAGVATSSDESDDVALMRRLHATDASIASQAANELLRRGYRAAHLPLAERLTAADPEIRRRLAEELPALPDVDARPWLIRLSHDPVPAVRRTAASVMATSQDPALRRRLRFMAGDESDPDVHSIVRGFLEPESAARRK